MMSHSRHTDPEPFVRSYAVTHPTGTVVPPQPPGWDHLLYAASGVMTVVTMAGRWVVPPRCGVWVPSATSHHIEIAGRARLRNLYLAEGIASTASTPKVLQVSPLLRELVLRAVALAPLWRSTPHHRTLVALLVHEVDLSPTAPLSLPMPTDSRAAAVARALITAPGTPTTLDDLASAAGASRRTVERCFRTETGLALAQWRNRLRVLTALRLLAEGRTVAATAAELGYANPSSFVAMFRRQTGSTPSRSIGAA